MSLLSLPQSHGLLRRSSAPLGAATMLAGFIVVLGSLGTAAAQTPPPNQLASLKTVPVPEPPNLAEFVTDKAAAIRLGKALFWDMQVGSDGVQACASCHFHAGADSRTKNQLSPGLLAGDRTFQLGGPNYTLSAADFPFHRLTDVNNRASTVLFDTNDVASSQGVFRRDFVDVVTPGTLQVLPPLATTDTSVDRCNRVADPDGFTVGGVNVRRVEPRNTPTMINAVYNFRNFWDGRANNNFNGANPFGDRDPDNHIWKLVGVQLQQVHVQIPLGSLASQAVGPPGSPFEMSCANRAFAKIGHKLLAPGVVPLAKQVVAPDDSELGPLSRSPGAPGLLVSYNTLIEKAFNPAYWVASSPITLSSVVMANEQHTGMSLIPEPSQTVVPDSSFNQMEANFSLFFGLSVQLYESTLIANDTRVDRFLEGNTTALSADEQAGMAIFTGPGKCIACHGGPELTNASVRNVTNERLERMHMGNDGIAVYDNGFYNIGTRPTEDDLGVGGSDPFGNPLSETRYCQQFVDQGQACPIKNQNASGQFLMTGIADMIVARPGENIPADRLRPSCPPPATTSVFNPITGTFICDRTNVMGAFKAPQLRNVELTGPYFHNGGKSTLLQVVDFYNRGGDFADQNQNNLDPNIQLLLPPTGLSEAQKLQLVAFLVALTDDRVRFDRAPFDHPSLCIANGHPGNNVTITDLSPPQPNNPVQEATDALDCSSVQVIGAGGRATPIQPFLNLSPFQR